MKNNTKRLLVWMYPIEQSPRWVEQTTLPHIVPDLTETGLKSLLYLLKKNQYITSKKISGKTYVSCTSHGMSALEEYIPVFSKERRQWDGMWSIIVFLKAPKGDTSFRYLRKSLVSVHAIGLTRGVFLYPGALPSHVHKLVNQLYRSAVVIFESDSFSFGDEHLIIGSKTTVNDLIEVYSGISREIDGLIEKESDEKVLKDADKLTIYSVFDRLYTAVESDLGLVRLFFPQVSDGVAILERLQSLS